MPGHFKQIYSEGKASIIPQSVCKSWNDSPSNLLSLEMYSLITDPFVMLDKVICL